MLAPTVDSVNDHPLDAILYPILLRHKRNSHTNLWIATPPHLPPCPHPYTALLLLSSSFDLNEPGS